MNRQIKKNIDQSSFQEVEIEPGFVLLKAHNVTMDSAQYFYDVSQDFLQMHFFLNHESHLIFAGGHYVMTVGAGDSALLYNPNQRLPILLDLPKGGKYLGLLISIDKFHTFFSEEAELIHFLDADSKNKKYYKIKEINSKESIVLQELFNYRLRASLERLYKKGKVFELLSYYFHKNEDDGTCPFLKDDKNVQKILQAKSIVIERVAAPPGLADLATEIGLSQKKLKDGFKQIYGTTIYQFLFEYKMDMARKYLEGNQHNVTEISDLLGYSMPSHFIVAFKQKYGITPKKYMMEHH